MSSPRPGSRLGGRYRLTERLAFGGMGEVWQGVDEVLGRAVAVKILRPDLAGDNAFRRRFREEARTAGGLSHPGIAAVYDYGESPLAPPISQDENGAGPGPDVEDTAYLVMELVPGEALSSALSRDAPLDVDHTLDLVAQTARALHAAHLRGVVHRDVKPANLMVTPDRRVKVTDFGIARPQDHEPLTATGQVMGTAHYLAPELARGHTATPLSDVYALGVVAYECLAGRRPFEGDNQVAVATAHLAEPPPPLPDTLAIEVRRVVELAMEKDPELRFHTANAFATALESARYRLLAGLPPAEEIVLGEDPGGDSTPETGPHTAPLVAAPRTPGSTPVPAVARDPESRAGTTPAQGIPGPRRKLALPLIAAFLLIALIGTIGALVHASQRSTPRVTPTVPTTSVTTPQTPVIVPGPTTTSTAPPSTTYRPPPPPTTTWTTTEAPTTEPPTSEPPTTEPPTSDPTSPDPTSPDPPTSSSP
ncbi:MAG: protein kinase [Kineosporiaceae bacterium]